MKGLLRLQEVDLIIKGLEVERGDLQKGLDPYQGRLLSQELGKKVRKAQERIGELDGLIEVYDEERRDLEFEKAIAG